MHRRKDAQRLIRRGRRIYGAVYKLTDGREVYMAWRKTAEIFRGGEKMLSDAIAKGKAAWAIDDETLMNCRMEGVNIIGVWVTDTDDKYLAPISYFYDNKRSKVLNYEGRGGALQRYLPLEHFTVRTGSARVK